MLTLGFFLAGQGVLLILSTTVVTSITALSMSAISTNGEIKGGNIQLFISHDFSPILCTLFHNEISSRWYLLHDFSFIGP